ncbi:hypothetical protein ACFQS3_16750 [Glycomyces mayteni]|uniref:Uncharacterized protein n=1 Tax=Glycomyces mayteni TaxID=543887 RepID=A0ABW2D947_9ACTN
MPKTRWISAPARGLRRLAARVVHRTAPMPRLPFAVALAACAAALAVSLEWQPLPDDGVADVSELGTAPALAPDFTSGPQVEFEILEYGFSPVVDELGTPRVILGAVLRNPYDTAMVTPGSLDVWALAADGTEDDLESFYPNPIPADTTVQLGFVLSAALFDTPVERLRVTSREPSFLAPEPADLTPEQRDWVFVEPLPELSVLAVDPLLSPDGYRVHYSVTSAVEQEIRISIMFRDEEGTLIGGLPAGQDPFSFDLGSAGWRTVAAGESVQELDLHASWIPEGADLDRIEIGPRRFGG